VRFRSGGRDDGLTSIPRIEVPDKYESKNYSDLIEKYGLIEANKILNSLL